MASYIILLVAYLASFNINAVEYNSKIKCSNGACEKKETFKEITGPDLKIEKLAAGQCLLDVDKNIFYRIESVDLSTKKIVLISEIKEEPVTITMKRDTVYSDSKNFNVKLKTLPCSEVNGQIINDETKFVKCIASNGKRSFKLFCEKERKKNF